MLIKILAHLTLLIILKAQRQLLEACLFVDFTALYASNLGRGLRELIVAT